MTFYDWAFDGDRAARDVEVYGHQIRDEKTVAECESDYEYCISRGWTD